MAENKKPGNLKYQYLERVGFYHFIEKLKEKYEQSPRGVRKEIVGLLEDLCLNLLESKVFFPEKMRRIRQNQGMTLKRLGLIVNLTPSYLSQIERGVVPIVRSSAKKYNSGNGRVLKWLAEQGYNPFGLEFTEDNS